MTAVRPGIGVLGFWIIGRRHIPTAVLAMLSRFRNGGARAAAFAVGGGVAILYTILLLGRPHVGAMGTALLLYECYVLLVFSWTFFFSALFKHGPAAGGVSIVPLFVLPFLGTLWKPLGTWGPYGAVSSGSGLIGSAGVTPVSLTASGVGSAVIDLGLSLVLLLAAYAVLRRAEL